MPSPVPAAPAPSGTLPRPIIICVYCNKGGIGKTTTAAALAWLFGQRFKTLGIDANARQPSFTTIYNKLKVAAPYDMTTEDDPRLLGKVIGLPYEVIVIDCPPSDLQAKAALEVATLVVVPFVPKPLDTQALMQTIRHVVAGKPFRVLFTMIPWRLRGKRTSVMPFAPASRVGTTWAALAGQEVPMFGTVIREYAVHETSVATGWPVFTDEGREGEDSGQAAADDYIALYEEVHAIVMAAVA